MTVYRSDRGQLAHAQRLDNGWLKAPARLTRTGVFLYRNPDGTERRELRLPEEVFHPDALSSFELAPVTDGHPSVPLDASNTRELQRGHLGDTVRRDGDFVAASMLITDAGLVEKLVTKQKSEVSCGYSCDLDETPGEYDGEHYDAIQRNIRGNHVAIVDVGRAGPEVRVHVDRVDGVLVSPPQPEDTSGGSVKIRIDGVEYEGNEQLAQALARKDEKHAEQLTEKASELKAVTAERERLQARADSLEADLKKSEQARKDAEDPSKLRQAIRDRIELEHRATAVLGADVKLDGKSESEIRREVLAKLEPELKLDGKSDDYIQAALDIATEKHVRQDGENGLSAARRAVQTEREDSLPVDSATARHKFLEESRNAWKRPLTAMKPGAQR